MTVCSATYDMSTPQQPLWQPLSSDTSIRVLTLHPATKRDATIRTTLEEVRLTEKPIFEAISYTWGTDESQASITVNGFSIRIRQNLLQALSRFRLGHRSRFLWVDALCISQTDMQEKSQQVQQMGRTFREADQVLVWLGKHADESEALFQAWPDPAYDTRRKSIRELERRQRIWSHFLSRPYFTRTWIIQEVVSARSLFMYCGDHVMSWDKLMRFDLADKMYPTFDDVPIFVKKDSTASSTTLWDPTFDGLVARLSVIERFKKAAILEHGQHFHHFRAGPINDITLKEDDYSSSWHLVSGTDVFMTIADVAYTFRKTQCSDARDKIYALISLENALLEPIVPDYSLSVYQTLLSLVQQRAASEWRLAQVRPKNTNLSILQEHECPEAVKRMAGIVADTLGIAGDRMYFTSGGRLSYISALESLEEFQQVLDVLIEDEQKLTKAQHLVHHGRFEEAIVLYQCRQGDAKSLHLAQGTSLDVYDVFLAITRHRIARVAPGQDTDLSHTSRLNHTIQVAHAFGIPYKRAGHRWGLTERCDCWDKRGSRCFDYNFDQLISLEAVMLALEDFVSRKRAGVKILTWSETPEAKKTRKKLGLVQNGTEFYASTVQGHDVGGSARKCMRCNVHIPVYWAS